MSVTHVPITYVFVERNSFVELFNRFYTSVSFFLGLHATPNGLVLLQYPESRQPETTVD
jgi:hypothetical protein